MADSIGVDVSGLKKLARVLNRVEPAVAREFRQGMTAAGEVVATAARRNAAFSSRIPGTITVKRRGLAMRIQAGGDAAPHAAALEHGGRSGTFRHPLFGNRDHWVEQEAHPFLGIDESSANAGVALVDAAVDSALRGISVV